MKKIHRATALLVTTAAAIAAGTLAATAATAAAAQPETDTPVAATGNSLPIVGQVSSLAHAAQSANHGSGLLKGLGDL